MLLGSILQAVIAKQVLKPDWIKEFLNIDGSHASGSFNLGPRVRLQIPFSSLCRSRQRPRIPIHIHTHTPWRRAQWTSQ